MSDSGESDEERLSDLDAIAEALRAGELDAATRFGRERVDAETGDNDDGKPPSKILHDVRSESSEDESGEERQSDDATGKWSSSPFHEQKSKEDSDRIVNQIWSGEVVVNLEPDGKADVLIEVQRNPTSFDDFVISPRQVEYILEEEFFSLPRTESYVVKVAEKNGIESDWYRVTKKRPRFRRRGDALPVGVRKISRDEVEANGTESANTESTESADT